MASATVRPLSMISRISETMALAAIPEVPIHALATISNDLRLAVDAQIRRAEPVDQTVGALERLRIDALERLQHALQGLLWKVAAGVERAPGGAGALAGRGSSASAPTPGTTSTAASTPGWHRGEGMAVDRPPINRPARAAAWANTLSHGVPAIRFITLNTIQPTEFIHKLTGHQWYELHLDHRYGCRVWTEPLMHRRQIGQPARIQFRVDQPCQLSLAAAIMREPLQNANSKYSRGRLRKSFMDQQ
jgi:hypothetical protein